MRVKPTEIRLVAALLEEEHPDAESLTREITIHDLVGCRIGRNPHRSSSASLLSLVVATRSKKENDVDSSIIKSQRTLLISGKIRRTSIFGPQISPPLKAGTALSNQTPLACAEHGPKAVEVSIQQDEQ